MRFTVDRLDHVVLTCNDVGVSANWYQRVLGMEREEFGEDRRTALKFGGQKLNLHQAGREFSPHAGKPGPGSQDVCFITAVGPEDVVHHLDQCGVVVELGPVDQTGSLGPMRSVYCRDPDGNLVEIASYLTD